MAFEKRFWVLLLFALLTFLTGILGYELIEGWSFFDSACMTVVTLATLGYGETDLRSTATIFPHLRWHSF